MAGEKTDKKVRKIFDELEEKLKLLQAEIESLKEQHRAQDEKIKALGKLIEDWEKKRVQDQEEILKGLRELLPSLKKIANCSSNNRSN